jgi:hypothetical protein
MTLIERRDPTHVLTVRVPLYLPPKLLADAGPKFDAFRDTMLLVVGLSRLAWEGYLADTPEVSLEEPAVAHHPV